MTIAKKGIRSVFHFFLLTYTLLLRLSIMRFSPLYVSSMVVALASQSLVAAAQNTDNEPILLLNNDTSFHFNILAGLGNAIHSGGDIGPILGAAKDIIPGDMESFVDHFTALAIHTKEQAEDPDNGYDPVNVRDTWFSASSYFRMADFFLHGNWTDPRINSFWEEQTVAFDKGIAALPIPGERVRIPTSEGNLTVEAIWYSASKEDTKLPTLIVGNGYDAAQEDSYHVYVVPALARGWNCITYEGPGQPTVLRNQGIGFIPDWERVVTPVVDYVLSKKAHLVDQDRLVLLGNSMGGYLAARAAAFEPRLSALLLVGGIMNIYDAYAGQLPPELLTVFESGNETAFDDAVLGLRHSREAPTTIAWGLDQGLWTFNTHSPFDFFNQTKQFDLESVVDKIQMPVWIADAEYEGFFPGQPQRVADALGDRATLHKFTGVAGYHCQVGAGQELARVIFAWLSKTLGCP